jgi:hypothetical protein
VQTNTNTSLELNSLTFEKDGAAAHLSHFGALLRIIDFIASWMAGGKWEAAVPQCGISHTPTVVHTSDAPSMHSHIV